MNMQKGKVTVTSIIVFCILVLVGIMVFKHVVGNIDKKQIKKEVFDEVGIFRGAQLSDAKVREIIAQVLEKRSLQPLEVFAEIDSRGMVYYSFKYELMINYILFKRSEIVEVEGEMENYGG